MKQIIFLTLLIISHSLCAELTPLNYGERLSFSISHRAHYTHQIDLDIYLFKGAKLDGQWLEKNLQRAQDALDQCGILLNIRQAYQMNTGEDWLEWEDVEFNSGEFSEWERTFFSQVESDSSGIIISNTLNWSDDPELYHGIGYAPFLPRYFDFTAQQLSFYQRKMAGHVVLSKYAGEWTVIHEVGHAVMNLEHDEGNPHNIMFPFYKASDATFSGEQCEFAKQQVRVHPLQ